MRTRTLALSIALATTAHSGTLQQAYEQLWLKRAIQAFGQDPKTQKPKAACVCQEAGANLAKLGALAKFISVAECLIPTFDGAGNVSAVTPCFTFEYIGK